MGARAALFRPTITDHLAVGPARAPIKSRNKSVPLACLHQKHQHVEGGDDLAERPQAERKGASQCGLIGASFEAGICSRLHALARDPDWLRTNMAAGSSEGSGFLAIPWGLLHRSPPSTVYCAENGSLRACDPCDCSRLVTRLPALLRLQTAVFGETLGPQ